MSKEIYTPFPLSSCPVQSPYSSFSSDCPNNLAQFIERLILFLTPLKYHFGKYQVAICVFICINSLFCPIGLFVFVHHPKKAVLTDILYPTNSLFWGVVAGEKDGKRKPTPNCWYGFLIHFLKTSCLEIILKSQKICNSKNTKIVQNNCTPFTLKYLRVHVLRLGICSYINNQNTVTT